MGLPRTYAAAHFVDRAARSGDFLDDYRADIHDFELYSVGLNGIDERGAGDDVTDHDKRYSCSDYSVGCPYGAVELLQVVLVLFFASSLLYLAASLSLTLIRRTGNGLRCMWRFSGSRVTACFHP